MAEKILILGGTEEAARLAAELVAEGHDVTTSLAGRTSKPSPVAGKLRIGGFGGSEGLARYLNEQGYTRLIDATHPFARQISANARLAAERTGITFDPRIRPPWIRQSGDNWLEVSSLEEARDTVTPGARVLLALCSQHIAVFATRADVHFIIRMVDPPDHPPPLPDHEIILGKPGTVDEEIILIQNRRIGQIVCRNSGGTGAYAKLEAARRLGLPVIIIGSQSNR
jgi:precorrin-6A/cobalt-precorrin-6A reductase